MVIQLTILNLSNVIEQEIHLDHYNLSHLNFLHHKEILTGFDNVKFLNDLNNINDVDGSFYVLPNDEIDSSKDFINRIIDSKTNMVNDFFKIKKFLNVVLSLIVFFFTIFIIIIILLCLKLNNLCHKQRCNTPEILPLEELANLFVPRSS